MSSGIGLLYGRNTKCSKCLVLRSWSTLLNRIGRKGYMITIADDCIAVPLYFLHNNVVHELIDLMEVFRYELYVLNDFNRIV